MLLACLPCSVLCLKLKVEVKEEVEAQKERWVPDPPPPESNMVRIF